MIRFTSTIRILLSTATVLWNLSIPLLFTQQNGEYNSIAEALKEPEKVIQLNLTDQGLTSLPDELLQCVNLQRLALSVNSFTQIPEVVFKMTQLKSLSFSGAWSYIDKYGREEYELDSLPEGICNLVNLEYLILSYNQITSLPKIFRDCRN